MINLNLIFQLCLPILPLSWFFLLLLKPSFSLNLWIKQTSINAPKLKDFRKGCFPMDKRRQITWFCPYLFANHIQKSLLFRLRLCLKTQLTSIWEWFFRNHWVLTKRKFIRCTFSEKYYQLLSCHRNKFLLGFRE